MRAIWRGLFRGEASTKAEVRLCERAPVGGGGTLWVMPGCDAPPGAAEDLWWYRPLSLDELASVLRFVGRTLPTPVSRMVLMNPRQLSPSPRKLVAALASGLSERPGFRLWLVMSESSGRWPAALKRELHRCGVVAVDECSRAIDR